ncbi:hypothetical protein GCWU000341_02726 [Oribacterium sp. oral taxon 078 str. F0262]|uniref:DUF4491 family protein n=1 Tax=Oribacterium sp. oral taxon 078 TaxID=652706 RepID=UPI0001BCB813|nr:DUF4491 family protein [Oribacterium sp. oral taxon 078]EFE90642.1 hypothetical protein GCWU000341_02726 [Oribacterium sp. oral taxon 078 str. F0262]
MNCFGLAIGLGSFLMIGLFHPIVVKSEYYFGKGIWPLFAIVGIFSLTASLLWKDLLLSSLLGIFGSSCLWSIRELYEQAHRVKKGWFPKNPKRKR